MSVNNFSVGDVSGSQILTDSDHVYGPLWNELREALNHYVFVDLYDGDDLGEKINNARAAQANGTFDYCRVVLPPGEQTLSTSANFTRSDFFLIDGPATKINVVGSGLVAFDCAGSIRWGADIGWMDGDSTSIPAVGFFLATTDAGETADNVVIKVVLMAGRWTSAPIYHIGGEEVRIVDSVIQNTNNTGQGYAIMSTQGNIDSITSSYVTAAARSTVQFRVSNSFIASDGAAKEGLFYLDHDECYFNNLELRSMGSNEPYFKIFARSGDLGVDHFHFHNIRARIGPNDTSTAFIEFDDDSQGSELRWVTIDPGCYIQCQKGTGNAGYLIRGLNTAKLYKIHIDNGRYLAGGNGIDIPGNVSFLNVNSRETAFPITIGGNLDQYYIATLSTTAITVTGTDTNGVIYYFDLGKFKFSGGILTKLSTANTSNPPTDAQLDSAFGTPATVGAGFVGVLDDAGAGANFYIVASDGTNWWQQAMTKAV